MRFTLTIDMGNDAMSNGHDVAAALAEVAEEVAADSYVQNNVYDANGNRVGHWEITED